VTDYKRKSILSLKGKKIVEVSYNSMEGMIIFRSASGGMLFQCRHDSIFDNAGMGFKSEPIPEDESSNYKPKKDIHS
jgi:hypothetical protein